ncbi:hypothetical protein CLE01_33960 [Cryobacterium levicorallinum]|nr:hypothetical protein CLE01_33960 [Cryobacterium levicorallinum]
MRTAAGLPSGRNRTWTHPTEILDVTNPPLFKRQCEAVGIGRIGGSKGAKAFVDELRRSGVIE